MDYYNLNEIKINIKYKVFVEEVLTEFNNNRIEANFYKIDKRKKNYSDAKAVVDYWDYNDTYKASIYLQPKIINWNDMYLFMHEAGHVINKHVTDIGYIYSLKLKQTYEQEQEIDKRENEADKYAIKKIREWLNRVKDNEKTQLEIIMQEIQCRIFNRS